MAMKRKTSFKKRCTQELPSAKQECTEAESQLCNDFSIVHGERSDLKDNVTSVKHPDAMRSTLPQKRITNFFMTKKSKEKKEAVAEAMFVFHSVKHHHPYQSISCMNKLFPEMFEDSAVAAKICLTAETNSEAIVNNVISHCTQLYLKESLDKCQYIGVSAESGSLKCYKIFSVVVQYFNKEEGIQSKFLDLVEFKNEDPDTVSAYLHGVLTEKRIDGKISSFAGQYTNTNFESLARKGENKIFSQLQCKLGRSMVEVGCPANILHNSIQIGADSLSVSVESVILKVYDYFSLYTIKVAPLMEYCEFVDETYQDVLTPLKTKWFPAIERFIQMFEALKSYFLSLDKCPVSLESFFSDEAGKAYSWFLHAQMSLFQMALKRIEKNDISVNEVRIILLDVSEALRERQKLGFVTSKVTSLLADLPKERAVQIQDEFMSFYEKSVSYLEKWSEPLSHLKHFDWVLLQKSISWKEVQYTFKWLCENSNCELCEVSLFDQSVKLKSFVSENQTDADFKVLLAHKKWVRFFKSCTSKDQYSELLKIAQFYFSLPGHNANVERVFSLINAQWTNERDQLTLPSIKAMLDIQYNMADVSCTEFYKLLCSEVNINVP